eukprot:4745497-Prymnesium_polylepis.1
MLPRDAGRISRSDGDFPSCFGNFRVTVASRPPFLTSRSLPHAEIQIADLTRCDDPPSVAS